jgi:hypothetical protein
VREWHQRNPAYQHNIFVQLFAYSASIPTIGRWNIHIYYRYLPANAGLPSGTTPATKDVVSPPPTFGAVVRVGEHFEAFAWLG